MLEQPPFAPLARHTDRPYVTIVLPCLNEEAAIAATVAEALRGLQQAELDGEVLVVDNGSTDRSAELAERAGARVIGESRRGYGAAHRAGIQAALGDIVVMADADQTYDLEHVGDLVRPLLDGHELVIANRLAGPLERGAMPLLHRHIGTPLLNRLISAWTRVPVADSQSGYRAFWRETMLDLNVRAPGMEYASEMLLKAGRRGLPMTDVPSTYRVRVGESKLRTFSDGWRHLRMILMLDPYHALMLPGLALIALGLLLSSVSLLAPVGIAVGGLRWGPVFLGPMLLVLGAQSLFVGSLAAAASPLTPGAVRRRLAFLRQEEAVNRLVASFALLAALGVLVDGGLFIVWILGSSSVSLVGIAGLGQALIIIGGCGIATTFASSHAHELLGLS